MPDTYAVAADNVLGLRTNGPKLKWSWGVNMPAATAEEFAACAVKIELDVTEVPGGTQQDGRADRLGKYHYFSGEPSADRLSYARTLLGRRDLRLQLSGLVDGRPRLEVNPDYLRYVTHRFMNLHSAGYIMTDVAALMLLRKSYAPLHCSAFRYGDATVLVLAPPNTGKTLTAMMACLERGGSFLAEDLAITDGETLYSVPWTSTFRYYDRIDTTMRSRALNRLTQLIPPVELLPLSKSSGVDTLMSERQMLASSTITHVVILERGQESVGEEKRDEAYRKALNLNRYEFNYTKAPALVAYEFFNPDICLDDAGVEERRILRRVVDSAAECLVVRTGDATRYAGLIIDHLERT